MRHTKSEDQVRTWLPKHLLPKGITNPETGSLRVRRCDVATPEFQRYLKERDDFDLIAEGDSWFDLIRPRPGYDDLIGVLEDLYDDDEFDYSILNIAKYGESLDMIAYGYVDESRNYQPPGFDEVVRLARHMQPAGLLFSAGGNDIVGPEFKMMLNHARSGRSALRTDIVKYIIHDYIKNTYIDCAKRLWTVSASTKVFVHGYANAFPSGIGYNICSPFGCITLAGPWLLPSFLEKGYKAADRRQIIIDLMNEFNLMLKSLVEYDRRFVYVDFRNKIGEKEEHWDDELHLGNKALKIAGKYFAAEITKALAP